MRRTKIVATIGPATDDLETMRALVRAGLNVARLNTAHGSLEIHKERIRRLRQVAEEEGRPLAILLDVQGPKIRLGDLPEGRDRLEHGETVYLTPHLELVDQRNLHLPYPQLMEDLQPGGTIFIDDGLIELRVEEIEDRRVRCETVVGGPLSSRKGVTLPGVNVTLPPMTDDDRTNIRFGIEQGVDMFAISFVRRAEHVRAAREFVRQAGGNQPLIGKIENAEGVARADEILDEADGLMVARGDLGVELPPEEVPLVQKMLIAKCNAAGKPVITATQMLDSMLRNPRPTRAEATDVANAIFDGTDAVMLSGETAVGNHPVRAVQMMDRIARRAEAAFDEEVPLARARAVPAPTVTEAIARATCELARDLKLKAILCSTTSGATARKVARFRPKSFVVALTPTPEVVRHLAVVWGVHPLFVPRTANIDEMIDVALNAALRNGYVEEGDRVAIAAGVRTGTPGSTNFLQVVRVGEAARWTPIE